MIKKLTEKTDIKIFILYLLKQIERPIDFVTLNDIAVWDGFVGQFDFMDCFYELSRSQTIKKVTVDGAECYTLTDEGAWAAETLKSDIAGMIREKSVKTALRLLSFNRREARTGARLEDLPGGKCRLVCTARDIGGEFMNVSLVLETRHQAELMRQNYEENPELLYRGILGVLSGDINYLAEGWENDEQDTEDEDE